MMDSNEGEVGESGPVDFCFGLAAMERTAVLLS